MEEQASHVREIARLEALVAGDPGASAFPALAEANRRAGRVKEAERVAREGLQRRPELLAGRVALALALLDLGATGEARNELERVLGREPEHPVAAAAARCEPAPLDALADEELDEAFADAESHVEQMRSADDVAAEAMRAAALDGPEGVVAPGPDSPFATETVASLLAEQGHEDDAAAVRAHAQARQEVPPGGGGLSDAQRERVIAKLETWLEHLRRGRP